MNERRLDTAVAYEPVDDRIYVIGGWRDGELDSCEYYDIDDDKWNMIRRINQRKHKMSAAILDQRFIYAFGGDDDIEQYDIAQRQTWIMLYCKLPKRYQNLTSIAISRSEILLFGGTCGK